MRKFIVLLLPIVVASCASKNSRKEANINDSASEQIIESGINQVVAETNTSIYEEEKEIMEPGVTYTMKESASDTDIFGGDVNLKIEFTIYNDGTAKCTLIETNSEDFYDNNNSYKYSLEGEWEEVSKHDKRFIQIDVTLESDDYYKEFTYFIDEELNAYAENINSTPVKLQKK